MKGGLPVPRRDILCFQWRRGCRRFSGTLGLILALGGAAGGLRAEEPTLAQLLSQARTAYQRGDFTRALTLASRAIQRNPRDPQGFLARGWLHEMLGSHRHAIADYDAVVKLDPKLVEVYNRRGSEHFKLGHIEASIADFDRAIELDPKQEPYHWQRGISYYYAGLYRKGRDQFQSHQRVNANDVENAVWHFLCGARLDGVEPGPPVPPEHPRGPAGAHDGDLSTVQGRGNDRGSHAGSPRRGGRCCPEAAAALLRPPLPGVVP